MRGTLLVPSIVTVAGCTLTATGLGLTTCHWAVAVAVCPGATSGLVTASVKTPAGVIHCTGIVMLSCVGEVRVIEAFATSFVPILTVALDAKAEFAPAVSTRVAGRVGTASVVVLGAMVKLVRAGFVILSMNVAVPSAGAGLLRITRCSPAPSVARRCWISAVRVMLILVWDRRLTVAGNPAMVALTLSMKFCPVSVMVAGIAPTLAFMGVGVVTTGAGLTTRMVSVNVDKESDSPATLLGVRARTYNVPTPVIRSVDCIRSMAKEVSGRGSSRFASLTTIMRVVRKKLLPVLWSVSSNGVPFQTMARGATLVRTGASPRIPNCSGVVLVRGGKMRVPSANPGLLTRTLTLPGELRYDG